MDITPIVNALTSHSWVLLGALLIGLFVALAKQSQLGAWIASKLPKTAIPLYAPLLGVLGMSAAEVIAGGSWQKAVIDGFNAGILAVFGHELLIEGLRKGVEIVPAAKTPPSDGAGSGKSEDKPTDTAVTKPALKIALRLGLLAFGTSSFFTIVVATIVSSCTPQAKSAAIDLTDAVCKQLESQPEPTWVVFSCEIVQAGETILLTAKVPSERAKTFAAAHTKR